MIVLRHIWYPVPCPVYSDILDDLLRVIFSLLFFKLFTPYHIGYP